MANVAKMCMPTTRLLYDDAINDRRVKRPHVA